LEQLAIQNHNIGDKGAIALADGLKQNTTVRLIDLSHNKIGEVGIVALAEAIKQNATIELVILQGIYMTAKGSAALNKVWERIREVMEEDPHQNCVGCGCCADWL
jgi:Ran GTPase-activating protein (RanGAP) involved in mRNA processing and transport